MAWTKRDILDAAFTEIGMGEYVFDVQPEELRDALARLDAMMGQWEQSGVVSGYTVVDSAIDVALVGDSGLSAGIVEAVILNLAMRLAPMFGKQVSMETRAGAKAGYNLALSTDNLPPKTAYNVRAAPLGAGWKSDDYQTVLEGPSE